MPDKLKHLPKGLISLKNNDNKCFPWFYVRHLNPLKKNSQRIKKADKTIANNLDFKDIKFLLSKKDYKKIEKKNNICINVFCYESDLVYPIHISKQKF